MVSNVKKTRPQDYTLYRNGTINIESSADVTEGDFVALATIDITGYDKNDLTIVIAPFPRYSLDALLTTVGGFISLVAYWRITGNALEIGYLVDFGTGTPARPYIINMSYFVYAY